jgi:tetratricopeptide (TPR) repeat protein
MYSRTGMERPITMNEFFLRSFVSKLSSMMHQNYNLHDVWSLYNEGAYQEAYNTLLYIIDSQSKSTMLGNLYVLCAELELRVSEDPCKALRHLEKAQQIGCLDLALYYEIRGNVMCRLGKHDKGIQDIYNGLAIQHSVGKLVNLGRWLSFLKDERADGVWEQVLDEDPNNCAAFIYIGLKAAQTGNRDKAMLMVEKAKELKPSAENVFEIGTLYYELNLFDDALKAYFKAYKLRYEPKCSLYTAIASSYFSLGDYKSAIEYASRALDLNYNDDYAKDVLLNSTEEAGDEYILDRLIEAYPNTCLGFIILAQKSLKHNEYLKIYEILSNAKTLKSSPTELFYIGRIFDLLSCWEQALDEFLESYKLGYYNKGQLYGSIAECYFYLNDYDLAINYAIRALSIDLGDEYAKDILYACRQEVWVSEFGDNY